MPPVDMYRALTYEPYARDMYIKYKQGKVDLTGEQLGQIVAQWKSYVPSWDSYVENDDNDYSVTDEDRGKGSEWVIDKTGYRHSSHKDDQLAKTIGNGVVSAGEVAGAVYLSTSEKFATCGDEVGKFWQSKKYDQNTGLTKRTNGKDVKNQTGLLWACAADVAATAVYELTNPNKEQHEAITDYNGILPDLDKNIDSDAGDIDSYNSDLIDLNTAANDTIETANSDMETNMKEYKKNQAVLDYANSAVTQGCDLSDEDKKEYAKTVETMTQLSEDVTATDEDARAAVSEINEEMLGYEQGYTDVCEQIGQRDGITNEMSKVDVTTEAQCKIAGIEMGVSGAMATVDATRAICFGLNTSGLSFGAATLYVVAGAAAAFAGGRDYMKASEQFKWADEATAEIKTRRDTTAKNNEFLNYTNDMIDARDEYYDAMTDLETKVPDGIEPPDPTIPEAPDKKDPKKP